MIIYDFGSSLAVIADAWQTGVWKGLFLALPLSVAHLLIWRVSFYESWKLGVAGVCGKCVGELLLIFSIILGWRSLFHTWYFMAPILMLLSVTYIVFVTTFTAFPGLVGSIGPRNNFKKTWSDYLTGFSAHVFLGITQQTYICHRLSNIALDWDDKISFGSLIKTPQGYLDQTITGTTFSFCIGLIAGYLLVTFLWFYFGTFCFTIVFSNLQKLEQSSFLNISNPINTRSTSEADVVDSLSPFMLFYGQQIRPQFLKIKSFFDLLLQSTIFCLTWFHLTHYPAYYVPAEGLQLVSQHFDSKIFKSEYEQKIPTEVPSEVDDLYTKLLLTKKRPKDKYQPSPEFLQFEKEIKEKGGAVFGDRIYSRQLLTRFGPFMPIQKYGRSWGWGEYTEETFFRERDKLPGTSLNPTLKKMEIFDAVRWSVRRAIRLRDVLFLRIHRIKDDYDDEKEDEKERREETKKSQYFQSDIAKYEKVDSLLAEEMYQELEDKDEIIEKAEDSLNEKVGTFRLKFNKKGSPNNTDIEYFLFLERLREDPKKLARGLDLELRHITDDVYEENFPRLRPSLSFANELPETELEEYMRELEEIEDGDSSDESKENQKRIITILYQDPAVKAIAKRQNFWGMRSLYPFFEGVEDGELDVESKARLTELEDQLKDRTERNRKLLVKSRKKIKTNKLKQAMTDLTSTFQFQRVKRAEQLLQGSLGEKSESNPSSQPPEPKRRGLSKDRKDRKKTQTKSKKTSKKGKKKVKAKGKGKGKTKGKQVPGERDPADQEGGAEEGEDGEREGVFTANMDQKVPNKPTYNTIRTKFETLNLRSLDSFPPQTQISLIQSRIEPDTSDDFDFDSEFDDEFNVQPISQPKTIDDLSVESDSNSLENISTTLLDDETDDEPTNNLEDILELGDDPVVKKEKYRSVPPPSNPWKKEDKDIPFNLDNDFDVVSASIKPPVVLDEDALDTKRFLFDWFERQQRRVKKLTSKRKAVRKAEMTRFNFALREPLFTKTLLEKTESVDNLGFQFFNEYISYRPFQYLAFKDIRNRITEENRAVRMDESEEDVDSLYRIRRRQPLDQLNLAFEREDAELEQIHHLPLNFTDKVAEKEPTISEKDFKLNFKERQFISQNDTTGLALGVPRQFYDRLFRPLLDKTIYLAKERHINEFRSNLTRKLLRKDNLKPRRLIKTKQSLDQVADLRPSKLKSRRPKSANALYEKEINDRLNQSPTLNSIDTKTNLQAFELYERTSKFDKPVKKEPEPSSNITRSRNSTNTTSKKLFRNSNGWDLWRGQSFGDLWQGFHQMTTSFSSDNLEVSDEYSMPSVIEKDKPKISLNEFGLMSTNPSKVVKRDEFSSSSNKHVFKSKKDTLILHDYLLNSKTMSKSQSFEDKKSRKKLDKKPTDPYAEAMAKKRAEEWRQTRHAPPHFNIEAKQPKLKLSEDRLQPRYERKNGKLSFRAYTMDGTPAAPPISLGSASVSDRYRQRVDKNHPDPKMHADEIGADEGWSKRREATTITRDGYVAHYYRVLMHPTGPNTIVKTERLKDPRNPENALYWKVRKQRFVNEVFIKPVFRLVMRGAKKVSFKAGSVSIKIFGFTLKKGAKLTNQGVNLTARGVKSVSVPSLFYFSKPKKRVLHFANASLYFHDYLYTAKYFHLPMGEQATTFPYWRMRIATVILPKIITPIFYKAKNVKTTLFPKRTFFSRTLERKETLPESTRSLKASTAKTVNKTDFQTEYLLYQYQRSPLYRALINHNVSRMLDHDLPSTIVHKAFNKNETEAIKQKMFIYYQTKHLHNLANNEKFSFSEVKKPLFTDNDILYNSNTLTADESAMINKLVSQPVRRSRKFRIFPRFITKLFRGSSNKVKNTNENDEDMFFETPESNGTSVLLNDISGDNTEILDQPELDEANIFFNINTVLSELETKIMNMLNVFNTSQQIQSLTLNTSISELQDKLSFLSHDERRQNYRSNSSFKHSFSNETAGSNKKIKKEKSSGMLKSPFAYRIPVRINLLYREVNKLTKRVILDTIPFRTSLTEVTDKNIGIRQKHTASPIRVVNFNNPNYIQEPLVNTYWKPFIFSGPNLRDLPLQMVGVSGGVQPRLNRVEKQALDDKNLWNLTGKTFSGEKTLYRRSGPYSLGPLSFEPNLGSQVLTTFIDKSDKTLLPFFEDFWAARLRLGTYDSWLNILPKNSGDPLYIKARNTVLRLKRSQKLRINQLASLQKLSLLPKLGKVVNPNKFLQNFTGKQSPQSKITKDSYNFLVAYLHSFGINTFDDEIKIATNNADIQDEPSLLLTNGMMTFLQKDNRYKPWYHEEIYIPEFTDFSYYDPDSSLTDLFLITQELFSPVVLFSETPPVLSAKQLINNNIEEKLLDEALQKELFPDEKTNNIFKYLNLKQFMNQRNSKGTSFSHPEDDDYDDYDKDDDYDEDDEDGEEEEESLKYEENVDEVEDSETNTFFEDDEDDYEDDEDDEGGDTIIDNTIKPNIDTRIYNSDDRVEDSSDEDDDDYDDDDYEDEEDDDS